METVQEQRLQLKMMFLLGYNMKIVVLWGIKIWWGGGAFFLVEEDSKECADNGISVK